MQSGLSDKSRKGRGHVSAHDTRGVRNRNATKKYLEILTFRHLSEFVTFTMDGQNNRNKELRNKIDVLVVLDVECVDMSI